MLFKTMERAEADARLSRIKARINTLPRLDLKVLASQLDALFVAV